MAKKPAKKAAKKPAKKTGRPSDFTQALADQICGKLAQGLSLRTICKPKGMPPESTVRQWVTDNRENFSAQYTRARDIGLDTLADEIIEIADTPMIGEKVKTKGIGNLVEKETTTGDMVERSRLRVEARKWYLSKLAPKKYGDKLEISGNPENPLATLNLNDVPEDQLDKMIQKFTQGGQK